MKKIWTRSSDKKIIIITTAAAGLLFFHWLGWLNPVENFISRGLSPTMSFFYGQSTSASKTYNKVTDKRDLQKIISELESAQKKLLNENAQLQYLREENRVLRKFVNLFDDIKYDYVLARVVARESIARSAAERNRLVIDKGSKQGVQIGLAVIDQDGIIIGKINKVKDYIAEVALLTSSDCRLSVSANSSQKTIGVASGQAGLTVRVDYIPQTEKVAVDEVLVTSGLEPNVPHGFVVGKISEVNKSNNEIWQSAIVLPMSSLDNLRIVSVVLPPTNK